MLKGVHLTLLMGPLAVAPVPRPVTEALKSIQVTAAAGGRSGFQLSFSTGKRSLIGETLLPSGFFDPGQRVIIVVTVNGLPNVLMDGIITRQEISPSDQPGQSTLTVTGEDLTLLMGVVDGVRTSYPATPAYARVAMIIAKYSAYGIVPKVVPELLTNVSTPVQSTPMQKGTDLEYVESLAARNGYVFYLEPGPEVGMSTAYFGPEVRVGPVQPALSVNLDAHTNVDSLSFTYDGLSSTQSVFMVQIPQTKSAIPVPIPDVTPLRPPLAARPSARLRVSVRSDTAKLSLAEAAALGLAEAARSSDAVTGSGSLSVLRYGRVLQARRLVGVRGAGLAYDGLYYVNSVTHNLRRGQYTQSFSLVRNGLIPLAQEVPV